MSGTTTTNPYDAFDEAPAAGPAGPAAPAARTEVVEGRPMSTVGGLPQPTEQDQATAAREARESAGRVPRRRAQPQATQTATSKADVGGNPYDQFDGNPKDDGVALMERYRLNQQESYYRGSLAGSARLSLLAENYRTPDPPDISPERKAINKQMREEYLKIVADLAAYDQMDDFGSTLEATVAFGGQLAGAVVSPESWIGWGAKGATWIARSLRAGAQQAAIQTVTDPAVQGLNIAAGVQPEGFSPARTALGAGLGFTIGAGGQMAGEGLGKLVGQRMLRKQLYDLGTEDPSFDAARHAIWALDPDNGIVTGGANATLSGLRTGERQAGAEFLPGVSREVSGGTSGDVPIPADVRSDGGPSPRYEPGPEHGFADTVAAEKDRLGERQRGAKGGRLNEEAQFNAFHEEVGDVLDALVAEHQLDPEAVRFGDIWRFYDRQPGEGPEEALERSIARWVSEEERRAIQATDDAQLQRDLDEWARAYDAEMERAMYREAGVENDPLTGRYNLDRVNRRVDPVYLPGLSPFFRDYRPAHLPEEIPFEQPRSATPEGGDLSPGIAAESRAGEGTAGGGAEPAVRGERGGEGRAEGAAQGTAAAPAATDRGERLNGPREGAPKPVETLGGDQAETTSGGGAATPKLTSNGRFVDSRGAGVQYHGSSNPDLTPDSSHYSTLNYYGQGFYTTDAVDIANGYAKPRRGRGSEPTLYRVEERRPLKILDGEQPIPDDVRTALKPVSDYNGDPITDLLREIEDAQPRNMRQLYDELRDAGTSEGYSADTIQEVFDSINYALRELGYNGMSHAGGLRTGRDAHRVVIYFDPENDIRVTKEQFNDHRPPGMREAAREDVKPAPAKPAETPRPEPVAEARKVPASEINATAARMPREVKDEFELLWAMGANDGTAAARDTARFNQLLDEYGPNAPPPAVQKAVSEMLATERTAQGEQTLVPGVAPITDRQRIETEMGKPMSGGSKPPPAGGLFDTDARAQTDIFDMAPRARILDPQAVAERRRGGKMLGEPTRASQPAPSPLEEVSVRSLQQQSMDLAKALDFPLREGRVTTRNAAGIFSPRSGVVRVKEVPDFDVVSHEAGHALEMKDQRITALTKANAAELRPLDYDQGPGGRRVNEGFAEYVRLMMTNPAFATRSAPTFDMQFRRFMAENHPDLMAKIDAAQKAYKAYLEAPSVDAVGSVRRSVDENPRGVAKVAAAVREDGLPMVIKSVMQKSYDAIFDEQAPFSRAVRELGVAIRNRTGKVVDLKDADNPATLLRLLTRSRQGAVRDLMDGVRPYQSIAPEGPALADGITMMAGKPSVWGKWDESMRASADVYLIARRAEYLWRKYDAGEIPNPPVAFSRADALQTMMDLEATYPNFRAGSDMVHEYTRQLLRKAFDGGLIKRDLYDKLVQEEFYVPFMRDLGDRPTAGPGASGGGTQAASIVQRLRGSSRDIKSPLESIMAQTLMVNRTIRHNDVIRAFVALAERAGPEGGRYVERIPPLEARKYTADLEQAISNRAKDIDMDPAEAANIIAMLGDPEGGAITGSYFKMEQAAARGEPIVFYREGGELKAARFMSEKEGHALYELLTAAPEPVTDLWVQLVTLSASTLRTGIVTNPTFAIANYVRDQVAASILRSDYIPGYSGIRGIADEFRQGQNAVLYGYAGGTAGGASIGPVDRAFNLEVDALAKKGYVVNRLTSWKGFLELSSFTEAGTRNSIFRTVFEAAKRKGLSDNEAMVEAAFQAQDLLDFSRHGSRTLKIRNFLPFLNAHLQGLDKARRTMIEPITNRLRQGEVFAKDSVEYRNALMAWTKAGAAGAGLGAMWAALNWDSEAYQDASPYFKGTHFVVPWGNKMVVLPKPFELSIGFTAGEYAVHALAQKDPRALRLFIEAAMQAMEPPDPIAGIPLMSTVVALGTNKSMMPWGWLTGEVRDIVPEQVQRRPTEQQYTDRTSELAKQIGALIGVSPMKVDYAIGAQFGTWGRDAMALSQGVNENSPAASLDEMIFFRRFVKDPTRSSDVATRFWKHMSRTTGKFNQDVAGYNDMVREAVTRGQPITAATEFLSKLPAAERAFVTLKSAANEFGKPAFSADERRMHPLQNAYDAVEMLNGLRREIATNTQMTFGGRERVTLNPAERRLMLENVRELSQMFMRNSLTIMGEGGYANRPFLSVDDVMARIRHASPAIADEIATRMATAKVFKPEAIRQAWPELRDRLVRGGSEAQIGDLTFDAKAQGYAFEGQRARRPGIIRQPIAPTPVPSP